MLYLVANAVADSLSFNIDISTIADLPVYCANSKRTRMPKLWEFAGTS